MVYSVMWKIGEILFQRLWSHGAIHYVSSSYYFFSPVIKDPGIQNKKKLITNYYYLSEGNRISLHAAEEQPRAGMIINLLRKRYHELTYLLTYLSKYQCSLASRHGGETAGLWICWLYKGPSIWWWMNQWLKAQDYVDQI